MLGKTVGTTCLKRRLMFAIAAGAAFVVLSLGVILPVPVHARWSLQPQGQAWWQTSYRAPYQAQSLVPVAAAPRERSVAEGRAPSEFLAIADSQAMLRYTVRYKDDFNGNPGAILLTLHGDGTVELNTYSTPYHPLQGYTGFYTWQVGQDLAAEIVALLNSKEFAGESSQAEIKPDEAYQRLGLFKDNQTLSDRFYTSQTPPPPLTAEIMRRLHGVAREAMTSRPVRGLSIEMDRLPDIHGGEPIAIRYKISNTGTEAVSIDNFKAPALATLFISGEGDKDSIYVELDHTKFTSSRKPDATGALVIPEGDSIVLSYKITANNLRKGAYYVAAGSQLDLSYTGSAKIASQVLIYAKPQTFQILD